MGAVKSSGQRLRSKAWLVEGAVPSPFAGHHARKLVGCFVENMHTDHLHWSLPAHRRGTLRGMDAA
ncbi:hypothetical protein C7T87_12945 [Xanthomonas hortorum pv. hederae]|nr:hypothetical protein C7T87_12945 [Xanthomonas hortorum pv. hederae]